MTGHGHHEGAATLWSIHRQSLFARDIRTTTELTTACRDPVPLFGPANVTLVLVSRDGYG